MTKQCVLCLRPVQSCLASKHAESEKLPSHQRPASIHERCRVRVQVLKDAGAEGLQIGKIVQELQRRGLRTFEDMTKAKNSIGSSCGHEVAFARVSPGVFALRCLPGVVEVSSCLQPQGDCIFCLP